MNWSDEGIILGTRRHGESSLIVELMTPGHGRHLGLLKGGRRRASQVQPGNTVAAAWRARLGEHLGNWTLETVTERAGRLMEAQSSLYALQLIADLLRLLPERDPHPRLYETLVAILGGVDEPMAAGELMVRFELAMLAELGFGLDLSACAATGETGDLTYVSPKSGRAVGREAGAPYAERLLKLPGFLIDRERSAPSAADIAWAFRLTGFFLDRHLYEPRGLKPSPARDGLIGLVERMAA
jgi:DNA repair protein RecO (recombination protein O)